MLAPGDPDGWMADRAAGLSGSSRRGPETYWPLFDPFRGAPRLLLAVSGGPDSTALMHLAAGWAESRGAPLPLVASVDHGLRAASAAETQTVVAAAKTAGLRAERLIWAAPKPARGIAAAARAARYRLLTAFARETGCSHLLTGHTLDDQAETVLMRLARGSGVAGAAAMRPERHLDGVTLARPLLGTTKAELTALCVNQRWAYVEDPSNRNMASPRTRWRTLAPALAAEGLSAERLARFAARTARADLALERAAERAAAEAALGCGDEPRWQFAILASAGDEIVLRVLAHALARPDAMLRLERLEALTADLLQAARTGVALRRTLGRSTVRLDPAGILSVAPEAPRRRGAAPAPASSERRSADQPFTLTGRSLGKESRASYIGCCEATAPCADAVETHRSSLSDERVVLLSAGRQ